MRPYTKVHWALKIIHGEREMCNTKGHQWFKKKPGLVPYNNQRRIHFTIEFKV